MKQIEAKAFVNHGPEGKVKTEAHNFGRKLNDSRKCD